MAEKQNSYTTKTRITLAVLNRTIELQGQYTRERLDVLDATLKDLSKEDDVLHKRINRAKDQSIERDIAMGKEIATLKTKTGIVAGINSILAVIGSVIAAKLGMNN